MAWRPKKLLKPIFDMIAKPGLGNPHTPYEAELMTAGVKPVAIMSSELVNAKMREIIQSGHIVHIGEKNFVVTHRIYCRPDQIDNARIAADLLEKSWRDEMLLSVGQHQFLERFFGLSIGNAATAKKFAITSIFERMQALQLNLLLGKQTPEIQKLLHGTLTALVPVRYEDGLPKDARLDEAVSQGHLGAVDIKNTNLVQVFAQADHVEEGRELFNRDFLDGKGYPSLSDKEEAGRIGRLLGFTDNDLAWFLGEKYQNPIVKELMILTRDIRCWARKEAMLLTPPVSSRPPL